MNGVVGDESWIHFFEPHRKIRNQEWLTKNYQCKKGYGKCSIISNTLKLRTPKIIAENNF